MSYWELWQLQKYGNYLPDEEPEEHEPLLTTSETIYEFELLNPS